LIVSNPFIDTSTRFWRIERMAVGVSSRGTTFQTIVFIFISDALSKGLPSVIAGVVVFFALPNNPSDSKWLSEDEKNIVIQRIQNERLLGLQKTPSATSQTSLLSSSSSPSLPQQNDTVIVPAHADKKISWDDFKATIKGLLPSPFLNVF